MNINLFKVEGIFGDLNGRDLTNLNWGKIECLQMRVCDKGWTIQ